MRGTKHKPVGIDVLLALGGGKHSHSDDEHEDEHDEDDNDLPLDFVTAYDEYKAHPSAQALYDCIEACKGPTKKSDDSEY